MNYHAPRLDAIHHPIVRALEADGWAVLSLASHGCPVDILATDTRSASVAPFIEGATWLGEIKDGSKVPSKRRLKPACAKLMLEWPGPGAVVCSVAEALEAGALARRGALLSCGDAARIYLAKTGGVAK